MFYYKPEEASKVQNQAQTNCSWFYSALNLFNHLFVCLFHRKDVKHFSF